jgi:pimeloyl-ACP methyl ester carboxylesterase
MAQETEQPGIPPAQGDFLTRVLNAAGAALGLATPQPSVLMNSPPQPVLSEAAKPRVKALILSGWGNASESLDNILPSNVTDVSHFRYHHLQDKEEVMRALTSIDSQPDIVVGWSLGGKLAVNAVAEGVLKPKLLVLVGTSYEYVPNGGINNAVKDLKQGDFYENFRADPEETRRHFIDSMLKGDSRADAMRPDIKLDAEHDMDWLHWLKELQFGCEKADLSSMPRTLIVHGQNDAIVLPKQAEEMHRHIPNSRLEMIPASGHMPHLHASESVKALIAEEMQGVGIGAARLATIPQR